MTPATSENETVHFYPFDRMARHSAGASISRKADSIDIEAFVAKEAIDWTWYDKAHYMVADNPAGEFAFSVIRDAMEETGTVAIAHLVLHGCERAIMLEPRDIGIVLWTLRRRDDALAPQDRNAIDLPKPDRATMERVASEIDKRWKPWHPLQRDMVFAAARKPAGRAAKEDWGGNVVDIADRRRQARL